MGAEKATRRARIQHGTRWLIVAVGLIVALGVPCNGSAQTTEALIDSVQRTAFNFFWNEANPSNGLVKDRSTSGSPSSIASVGFGLSAICIGIDHGWVSREVGRARVLTTLNTFWNGPQGTGSSGMIGYKGLFYHFLDMNTAARAWSSELSTIDSALFLAGALDCKQYFSTADPLDGQVRMLADSLCERADWNFARNNGVGIRMGWTPESGFGGFGTWVGYNEAMIMYILALGSPTHSIPASNWFTWTSGYHWATEYGQTYVTFPPLFGHQYSHCWIDYRFIQDVYMQSKGITYFENSRRAAFAARAYSIDNPGGFVGYDANVWGLTASDGPFGYGARGAPPAQNDDGTITPTAALSCIAFAPEIVIPTMHYFWDNYKSQLWSSYGFKDAFNLTQTWWATDYIGIDQGPIIIMMENYLNRSVWNRFMQNTCVQNGLAAATFVPATVADVTAAPVSFTLFQNSPNPVRTVTRILYELPATGHVSMTVYDVKGRVVRRMQPGTRRAGLHEFVLSTGDLADGVYYYRMQYNLEEIRKRMTILR